MASVAACEAGVEVRNLTGCRAACCDGNLSVMRPTHWALRTTLQRMTEICCDPASEAPSWPPAVNATGAPNVLYLIAHDLRADMATPTLSALDDVVRFDHAFVQVPICTPSRFSAFSGRHAATTRFYGFNVDEQMRLFPLPAAPSPQPFEATPLASAFVRAGYATHGAGTSWADNNDGYHPRPAHAPYRADSPATARALTARRPPARPPPKPGGTAASAAGRTATGSSSRPTAEPTTRRRNRSAGTRTGATTGR